MTEKRADFLCAVGKLKNEARIAQGEYLFERDVAAVFEAYAVAERHLHYGLRYTAHAGGVTGRRLAGAQKLGNAGENVQKRIGFRQTVFVRFGGNENDFVSGALEFGRDYRGGLFGSYGERDEGGRNVEILKRAAHRVLAAY